MSDKLTLRPTTGSLESKFSTPSDSAEEENSAQSPERDFLAGDQEIRLYIWRTS